MWGDVNDQAAERMGMRMSELVENVSKKPIAPWTKNLLVEVMVNDENDEDVEVSPAVLTHPTEPKLTITGPVLPRPHLEVKTECRGSQGEQ